ncbi:hypothetical protein FRC07_010086 [Ceratobasidium sp. 392]|nr:hypothetical protein FRC07_010086 [Ceratobasidium sp. 392]
MSDDSVAEISSLFSFQPPPEGDLPLKSSDGILFHAHSALLALASPVFAGMITVGTRPDTVDLAEDAESISLMLRFIYPPAFLDNLPLPLLKKSLHMGQKYDISGIPSTIDYVISHTSDNSCPLRLDPINVFGLATTYQLKATQEAAARLIQQPQNHTDVTRLAEALPNHSSIIGLLGAHFVRTRSLLTLQEDLGLFVSLDREGSVDQSRLMMCTNCIKQLSYQLSPGTFYYPPWMQDWGAMSLPDFIYKPSHEYEKFFEITILNALEDEYACSECLDAARCAGGGEVFRTWASQMKDTVKEISARVEPLYSL